MDGSGYPPRYEKPQDDEVETGDGRPLALLVILVLAAGSLFFSLHQRNVARLGHCLMGGGLSCEDFKLPADNRHPDQPATDH